MRRRILVGAVLVGVGWVLLLGARWGTRPGAEPPAPEQHGQASERTSRREPSRPGAAANPSRPEEVPTPEATEADGVLEVQVLAASAPVPGARVRLYARGPRDPNLNEVLWRPVGQGTTDARGQARLAARPGTYMVAVHVEGRAPVLRDVVCAWGVARTTVRLTLEPAQVLTGRTVVRGTKEPVPLVELVLTPRAPELEAWQRAEVPAPERVYASSNERGDFRVEGLAPGNYQLEAHTPGYAREEVASVRVPSGSPLSVELSLAGVIEGFVVDAQDRPAAGAEVRVSGIRASPQSVTTGEGGGFSVEVEAGSYALSARRGEEAGALEAPLVVSGGRTVRDVRVRLGPGAVLEGRVVEKSSGGPVQGVHVDVSPYEASGDLGRAVTDAEGHFSVSALAPGVYDVVASAPGYSQSLRRGVTLTQGERFPLEITLKRTGSVEGSVKDAAGRPLQGVRVAGDNPWNGGTGPPPPETRTDAAGHYRLEGIDEGPRAITARREGASMGIYRMVNVEGDLAPVDFVLEETGGVRGRVRSAQGPLPAVALEVRAISAPDREPSFSGTPDVGRAQVSAEGDFQMVLPAGSHHLVLRRGPALGTATSVLVKVEAGKTAQAELVWEQKPETHRLSGLVLEPDGTPSPGALVSVNGMDGHPNNAVTYSGDEGRFVLSLSPTLDDPARTLRLEARNGGRRGEVTDLKAGASEVVVRLRPGASLRGRVVRAGAPVRGFTLSVREAEGGPRIRDSSPREFSGDRFDLQDLPPGPVRLQVRTVDGMSGEVLLSSSPGAVSEVEIPLKAVSRVHGRVVDATTRAPLSGVLIFLENGDVERSPTQETDETGTFSLDDITAGEWNLVLLSTSQRSRGSRPLRLSGEQTLELGDIPLGDVPPGR